jgi:phosphatidylglycerol:prolipoprotein diacylglycerol transferase
MNRIAARLNAFARSEFETNSGSPFSPMHKILVANPQIGSYATCLVLALFCGYLISRWRARQVGVKPSHIDNLVLLIAVFSLFGARLFSWIFYFPKGFSFWQALTARSGGMVFYGGLVLGFITVLVYAHFARLKLGNLLDLFSPGLALGLAIGRIGCFMAGCCWGDLCAPASTIAKLPSNVSPWQVQTVPSISHPGFPLSVRFPPEAGAYEQHKTLGLINETAAASLPVHPVQLYESVLALVLCVFLHLRFDRRRWEGQILCNLLIGYAGIRFCTEFLRGDNLPAYLGMTLSQLISICLAVPAGAVLWWKRKRPSITRPRSSERGKALFPELASSATHRS